MTETTTYQATDPASGRATVGPAPAAAAGPASLLRGVRVLDLTNVLAGPFAGYQLALLGADVVKVEVPGTGDLARQLGADPTLNAELMGASFVAQNAGKRSVEVDLKDDAGRAALASLVRDADVLVDNFRPGVLARLGFSWERLQELNPRLVYCAISGFGQDGPLRDRPAYDQIIQGLSGMMGATGSSRTGPLRAGFPVADTLGGTAAAMAISAALVQQARTGRGARLDVSMLETAMTAMGWVVSNHLVAGTTPAPMGNDNMTAAPSGTFATGDGLLNIAANKQEQFVALCGALGVPEVTEDPRFAAREARKAHRAELTAVLEDALSGASAAHWEEVLERAGVPAGQVLGVADAIEQPQLRHRGLVHEIPHPTRPGQVLRVMGHGIQVDGRPSAPGGPPPLLGEHTDAVLAEATSATGAGR